ncbi:MAG: hypothetical protein EHM35_19445, partial [Planctomycetaceae bacterium]
TGVTRVVLDIDPAHGGRASLAALEAQHGPLPTTAVTLTGGGGEHRHFLPVPGLRNSIGKIAPGLDIRAEDGYVLLPPSKNAAGKPYIWADDRAVNPLSPDVLETITRQPREMTPSDFSGKKAYFPWDTFSRYGRGALARAQAHILEADNGERNKVLFGETKDIMRLVNGGEIDVSELKVLRDAALQVGLGYHETQHTMGSAYNSVGSEYRTAPNYRKYDRG